MSPLLAALVLALSGAPRYTAHKPHELIGLADLMVTGTIVEVLPDTVRVEVERAGFGDAPAEISVRRFRDWACAQRWAPYERGQRCLYFLHVGATAEEGYRILGAGGEGERRIEEGQRVALQRDRTVEVGELVTEARRYLGRFRFDGRGLSGYTVERRCSAEELAAYIRSSALARELALATIGSGRYRDPEAASPAPPGPVPRWDLGIDVVPAALVALPDLDGDGLGELASAQRSLSILSPWAEGPPRRTLLAGNAHLGGACTSIAPLGDLDGDGTLELAAGDPSAPERGAVWIFSLARDLELPRATRLALTPAVFGGAERDFAAFGRSLADAGDLDGDGRRELAVSQSPSLWGRAQVWVVFLDAFGQPTRATLALDRGLGAEVRLAGLGDLDGDGVGDLAASGESTHTLRLLLLARDGSCRASVDLTRVETEGFGRSLAALGDVDGDGTLELAVGAWNAVHVLSLARDGAVRRERRIEAESLVDAAPGSSSFGSALCAWPSAGGVQLLVGGYSWFERTAEMRAAFPSLWLVDPR